MKYQPPKFTDKEYIEMFSEAKEIIPVKIKEYVGEINDKEEEIRSVLEKVNLSTSDEFTIFFCEEIIKIFMLPELIKLKRNLCKLNHLKVLLKNNYKKYEHANFEEKIQIARRYPIGEIAENKLTTRRIGKNYLSLCPFHSEKTPSFYIYSESNRYFCFGCQAKGDTINLTMELYGIGFKEAVELLQN